MISRSNLLRSLVAVAACVLPSLAPSSAEASLPGGGQYSHFFMNGDFLKLSGALGRPVASHTCFLSGVGGFLAFGDAAHRRSTIGVLTNTSDYYLKLDPGADSNGNNLSLDMSIHAVCVNAPPTTIGVATLNGDVNVVLAPSHPGRQCFLQSINGTLGSFHNEDSKVWVEDDGTHWRIHSHETIDQGYGAAVVTAVCTELPQAIVMPGQRSVDWAVAADFNVGFQQTAAVPVAMGLTGIAGPFNGDDFIDGALLTAPGSNPGFWSLHLENAKSAFFLSMK